MARDFPLEMGGGGGGQMTESTYAREEGYVRSVRVRTRGEGGGILAILVRTD